MRSPYLIDGPAVISFSGGRTSGMLLFKILEAHGGRLPEGVHAVFANTGKEAPQTLDFVQECAEHWGVPITWLEYHDHDEAQKRWRQVDHSTASREGEPFAALIGRRKMLPNPVTRFCTADAKIKVMKLYAQQVLGFDHWEVVIGFRADEPGRVAKLSAPHKEPYERSAPLARAGVTKRDVMRFWQAQPFDLRLQNVNGTTPDGNCDLCFLKGAGLVYSKIRKNPELAIWWMAQERRIPADDSGNGHLFRSDRPSYARMYQMAHDQAELIGFEDDISIMDCACTD